MPNPTTNLTPAQLEAAAREWMRLKGYSLNNLFPLAQQHFIEAHMKMIEQHFENHLLIEQSIAHALGKKEGEKE